MKRTSIGLFFAVLAPFAACQSVTGAPDDDAGAPDTSVSDTGTPDTSRPDAGDAGADSAADAQADGATDGGGDGALDAAPDATPDASLPVRAPMCGVLDGAAPADGTFYDTTPVSVRDRGATTLLSAVFARNAWVLWDARTGQRLARGLGRSVNDNDTRAMLRGNVLLVPQGGTYETRDASTGVVIHSFAAPGVPFRAYLPSDGSYVALITDTTITLTTPQGTVLRAVPVASLPLAGILPYGSAAVAVRNDGVWIAPSNGDTTVFVPKSSADAPRAIGPFAGAADSFNKDGSLAIYTDFGVPAMATFRDVTGAARGAGLALGTFQSWGNYAWIVTGTTVTLYSVAGANAAVVGTYTKLGDAEVSSSGYLAVGEGVVSLRGAAPVLTTVAAYPPGATGPLAVDPTSQAWAMNAGAGGAVFGNALGFATFGEIAGCTELKSIAATTSGKLFVAFADHVEQLDTVTGRFDSRREIATNSLILASETGDIVVTDEPAAYDLVAFTKTATFTAGAVPLAVSPDGTRVALLLTATGEIEERNPRGGALLATRISASTTRRARALYSPDGTRLAVVRSVAEPALAGAPVNVVTDLYVTTGAGTAQVTHFPTYWETDALLATELLPSGMRNPPGWNAFEGTCSWSGSGGATCSVGAALGVRGGPDFSTYQRRSNGMLLQQLPARVREIGGVGAPWSVPDVPSSNLETRRATFAGKTFFWGDREGTFTVPAGIRRHAF